METFTFDGKDLRTFLFSVTASYKKKSINITFSLVMSDLVYFISTKFNQTVAFQKAATSFKMINPKKGCILFQV